MSNQNTCIVFPALRNWAEGHRTIHLTRKIAIQVDHLIHLIFGVKIQRAGTATTELRLESVEGNVLSPRLKTDEYIVDLAHSTYCIYETDTLIAECRLKLNRFHNCDAEEEAFDIEIFVDY